MIQRAGDRYRSEQPGIVTWHCFAAGGHYDPANVSFGRLVACDEHRVAPGAGFDSHAHVRVELLTWVLSGELRHTDDAGRDQLVRPGQVQYQRAGRVIRHSERNASSTAELRFVQMWFLCDDDEPAYSLGAPPIELGAGSFRVVHGGEVSVTSAHLFVAAGHFEMPDGLLGPGDTARVESTVLIAGAGELLVVDV